MLKWGAAIFISIFVIRELFGLVKMFMTKSKNTDDELDKKVETLAEKISDKLELKVNKEDCAPAMQRVGACIDKLEKANGKQNDTIQGLEIGVAYIVGKMGGDLTQLKKNGRSNV